MSESFERFMTRRESAVRAYVTGDPGGGFTEVADAVTEANRAGAQAFGLLGTTHFEIHDQSDDGDVAFWTGFQIAEVEIEDKDDLVPMKLRVTEVFRRAGPDWQMVHRHASRTVPGK